MEDQSIKIPPEQIFQRIKVLAESGEYNSAFTLLEVFEHYKEEHHKEWKYPTPGLILSYRGLCMARGKKNYKQGIGMCLEATQTEFAYPDCYMNLGRLYLDKGRRLEAHKAFMQGLSIDPSSAPLKREIREMGVRKESVFPFLSRESFLNRFFGRMKAGGQSGKEK
jgi:tetratricopeptide (TPR) repeat protein